MMKVIYNKPILLGDLIYYIFGILFKCVNSWYEMDIFELYTIYANVCWVAPTTCFSWSLDIQFLQEKYH